VAFEGPQHLALQPLLLPRRLVGDRDRMAAALAADHAGPIQLGGQRFQVEGGRHHQQPQLRAQQAAGLTHQGQGQIRFGPAGRPGAATAWLVAPCGELYQDDRKDNSVDLVIGADFTALANSDDIAAVLAGLSPGATEPADSALLTKIHNGTC
jgi:hypothetical protein